MSCKDRPTWKSRSKPSICAATAAELGREPRRSRKAAEAGREPPPKVLPPEVGRCSSLVAALLADMLRLRWVSPPACTGTAKHDAGSMQGLTAGQCCSCTVHLHTPTARWSTQLPGPGFSLRPEWLGLRSGPCTPCFLLPPALCFDSTTGLTVGTLRLRYHTNLHPLGHPLGPRARHLGPLRHTRHVPAMLLCLQSRWHQQRQWCRPLPVPPE